MIVRDDTIKDAEMIQMQGMMRRQWCELSPFYPKPYPDWVEYKWKYGEKKGTIIRWEDGKSQRRGC